METLTHSLSSLFQQLGLEGSDVAIDEFINKNNPVPDNVELYKAGIWTESQSCFLKQAIAEDADWAEIVDQLDVMLRERHP